MCTILFIQLNGKEIVDTIFYLIICSSIFHKNYLIFFTKILQNVFYKGFKKYIC